MISTYTLPEQPTGDVASPAGYLPNTVLEMTGYASVILSNLGLAMTRLPENSPARANIRQALQAAEQLADMSLALNDKVHADSRKQM